jgi:Aspartyl protease
MNTVAVEVVHKRSWLYCCSIIILLWIIVQQINSLENCKVCAFGMKSKSTKLFLPDNLRVNKQHRIHTTKLGFIGQKQHQSRNQYNRRNSITTSPATTFQQKRNSFIKSSSYWTKYDIVRYPLYSSSIIPAGIDRQTNSEKDSVDTIMIDNIPTKRRDVLIAADITAAATASSPVIPSANTPGSITTELGMSPAATDSSTTIISATPSVNKNLIADIPMIRIQIPAGVLGREYVAIQLKIQGNGPFDFLIDTGSTTEMITPHLQQSLNFNDDVKAKQQPKQGFGAGGSVMYTNLIKLSGASLCCGTTSATSSTDIKQQELSLPTLHAVITDFPQEHIDPKHDPIEGMIGMELLEQYDIDFDFAAQRFRLWKPGSCTVATMNSDNDDSSTSLIEIPAVTINETGLIGIRITTPSAASKNLQPILGFLDCGSTFSVVNWEGSQYLDLPKEGSPIYNNELKVVALGIDGKLIQLSTIPTSITYTGNVIQDSQAGQIVGFEQPPPNWQSWEQIQLAVGNLPAFASLLSIDGITPYKGPVALIGLDILSQRRVIIGANDPTKRTRQRRVLVGTVH